MGHLENKIQTLFQNLEIRDIRVKDFFEIVDNYIALEKDINKRIREISGPVCSKCDKVCCDEKFCESVLKSEFLCFVVMRDFEKSGKFFDISEQKHFLSPRGCILEAGRYPECTRFICLRIVQHGFKDPYEKIYYYGISNLLSGISNSFWGRYNLFDLEMIKILSNKGTLRLKKRIDDAKNILNELDNFKNILENTSNNNDNSEIRNYILKMWSFFPYAAKSMYIMREPSISLEQFYE